jgi:hypothetical protein
MEDLAPALAFMTLFVSGAAVLIFRPLASRLGDLIAEMQRNRYAAKVDDAELARVRVALEQVSNRLELMEERLDFTERLLRSSQEQKAIGATRNGP